MLVSMAAPSTPTSKVAAAARQAVEEAQATDDAKQVQAKPDAHLAIDHLP